MAKSEPQRSVRRSIAARTPMDYDNEIDGRRDAGAPFDDRTLAEGVAPVKLMRPQFNKGPMRFRPHPVLDETAPTTNLMPGRKSAAPTGQSNWAIRIAAAVYIGIGKSRFTFFLHGPRDEDGKKDNPYKFFYWACKDAFDSGSFSANRLWRGEWNRLMQGKEGEGAPISKPSARWRCFASVYQNADTFFVGGQRKLPQGQAPRDDLTMIDMPVSAGDSLIDLLATPKKAYEGDPEVDFAAPFLYGDVVGKFDPKRRVVTGGLFVTLFNPKRTKITKHTSWDGTIAINQGYEAAVSKTFEYDGVLYRPDLDSAAVDFIFEKSQFWLDATDKKGKVLVDKYGKPLSPGILKIHPFEQQMAWIAQGFSAVPQLFQFVFGDRPEWITDEVRGIIGQRRGVVIPGDPDADPDAEEERPRRRRREDDEPEERPRRRREDDEFEEAAAAPRTRRREEDEFEEPAAPRTRRRGDDEPEERPRRAARDAFDDEAPRSRRPAPPEDEFEEPDPDVEPEEFEEEEPPARTGRRERSLTERLGSHDPEPPDENEDDEFEEEAEEAEDPDAFEEPDEPTRARRPSGGRRPQQAPVEDEFEEEELEAGADAGGADEFEEEEAPAPRRAPAARRDPDEEPEPPRQPKRPHAADATPPNEYFGFVDGAQDPAKALAAANAARGRSAQRSQAPAAPPPAPPRSAGGTAKRPPGRPKGGKSTSTKK